MHGPHRVRSGDSEMSFGSQKDCFIHCWDCTEGIEMLHVALNK